MNQQNNSRNTSQYALRICLALVLVSVVVFAATLGGCQNGNTGTGDEGPTEALTGVSMDALDFSTVSLSQCTDTDQVTNHVRLTVSYTDANGLMQTGEIIIRLFFEVAPISVANFQELVKKDFYSGTTFHRIVEGFMIQGGAPQNQFGSSLTPIKGEFAANGIPNELLHVRGVVSMARTNDMNSATSQFFIVHEDSAHLDGNYAAFGYVVCGMDVVDGIATTDVDDPSSSSPAPVHPVTIESITFVNVTP